uniref:Uncharacterized protein n=1 Tax=Oryza nivara TaxID=4536 RepID=A0A0E0HB28_ORYNI
MAASMNCSMGASLSAAGTAMATSCPRTHIKLNLIQTRVKQASGSALACLREAIPITPLPIGGTQLLRGVATSWWSCARATASSPMTLLLPLLSPCLKQCLTA